MAIDWSQNNLPFLRKQLERGNVILFSGAGFSFDAKNATGRRPPLGAELSKLLAERAAMPFNNERLPVVFDAVRKRIGTQSLWNYLKELYEIESCAEWYKIVASITWARLYTTNIDNLLHFVYQSGANQRLDTIVCPAAPQDRDPHFRRLQAVHLHGQVNYPQLGFTFTLEEFAQQTGKPNPWYQTLADDLYRQSVLFVGTLLEEAPFHHYIEMRDFKDRHVQEFRPKSFLVCPAIGAIRAESLKDRNIQPIECTGEEFFTSIAAQFRLADLAAPVVCKRVFPHVTIRERRTDVDSAVQRYFDLILAHALPPVCDIVPENFFLGAEPTWDDIAHRRDGARLINRDLFGILKQDHVGFRCVVLHGPAGSGKTTTFMRVACDLAAAGFRVFYAKGLERIDLNGIIELAKEAEKSSEPVFIFIDVMARQLAAIDQVRTRLVECKYLTIVLAERSNKYYSSCQAIAEFNPQELKMPDLVEEDVVAILDRLKTFGYLGVLRGMTNEEQIRAFLIRASKQLLVAMREATSGQGFDAILRSEFGELPDPAKLAYTICCLAVYGGAPGVFRKHLTPCLPDSNFRKGIVINDLLRGVLVPANECATMLKPRHRLIAFWIATEVAPQGIKHEALSGFLRQIASDIVPNEIKRRSPAYLAYRGMINSEGLFESCGGDSAIILGLYDELRDFYGQDFLYWLQRGMAHAKIGELDIAENFLKQSLALNATSHQTLHHLGIIYLMQAAKSSNSVSAQERANEGIGLLTAQIRERGDSDSYPYAAYLTHVVRWYQAAGRLISPNEWEALRRVGQEASKKYPKDEIVKKAVQDVERLYLMRAVKQHD
ncbi:MAG: SIR2 family protein [Gemmataceae bacterium]|nr:SIR2 family protein [Gemmataceae bacterium]